MRFPELVLLGLILALLIVFQHQLALSVTRSGVAAVASSVIAYACTVRVSRSAASVGALYCLLLILFHDGLLIFSAFDLPVTFFNADDSTWFDSPGLAPAAVSVALGVTSFAFGYIALRAMRTRRPQAGVDEKNVQPSDPSFGLVGLALLALGAGIFFWTMRATGVGLIGASYGEFLTATQGQGSLATAYLLVGFGAAVTAAERNRAMRRLGMFVFVAFALPALLIGLRGEVMFPAAAWTVVSARRGNFRPRLIHGVWLLAALSGGSAIRELRMSGFNLSTVGRLSFSPLNGLIETGYSLRPLIVVHQWHDFLGQPFLGFGSYLDPFDRLVRGRLLGFNVVSADVDPRAFIMVIAHRVGQIGGSSIAEAYYAAGGLGTVVALGILGATCGYLDRLGRTPMNDAIVGMVAVIYFIWIRNDSTALAGQLVVAAVVIAAIMICQALLRQRIGDRRQGRQIPTAPEVVAPPSERPSAPAESAP